MINSQKIPGKFYLLLTSLVIAFVFAGCASSGSGSDSQVRSLEETVNSLKTNVTTLENTLNEVQEKNKAMESELQAMKDQINSLKISAR